MGSRGPIVFAVAFVVLPLLGLVGAWLTSGGTSVGLAIASLTVLALGFTVGLFLAE